MTTRDLKNNIDTAHTLEPAVRATGTSNGAGVDLSGYQAAAAVVYFGAYTNGTHTPSLEHSDDNSSFTAVSAAELEGAFSAISSGAGANTQQRVGYKGAKRYLRVAMVVTGGATGAASAALILRGEPTAVPV